METPPSAPQCLVFYGECLEGHDPMTVRMAVGVALKLEPTRTVRLFSGRRVVMKRDVSAEKAQAHVDRFARMGARLHVEPMSMPRARSAAAAAAALEMPDAVPALAPPRRWNALPWALGGLAVGALAVVALRLTPPPASADETPPATAAVASLPVATVVSPSPAAPASAATPPLSTPPAASVYAPPEDMGPEARRELSARYLQAPTHRAFAFSPSGAFGWAGGASRDGEARDKALSQCLQRQPPGADQACRVVHVDGQWVE